MATDASPGADAIRLSPEDNVATLLRAVKAGERLIVRQGATTTSIVALEAIALCHKISLVQIESGCAVLKYGHPIGEALASIPLGAHVHVHNMRSMRAQPGR